MKRQLGFALCALVAFAMSAMAGCGRTPVVLGPSSGMTDARFDGTTPVDLASSGEAAVAAFAHALGVAYRCHGQDMTDEEAWANQFENTDQACLARLLQENDELAQCTLRGSAEVEACLVGSGCSPAVHCDTPLLFEDTPLVELVERYCPVAVSQAYWQSLKAARSCRP